MSLVFISLLVTACNTSYTPKPMGYARIDFPEKEYKLYDGNAPYSFEIPDYSYVENDPGRMNEPYWINIIIPELNGTIHISYKNVNNNLQEYIEDSRTLVYKHTTRSDGIEETLLLNDAEKRYGILYDLKGNVASSVQFFLTDSSTHFLRGSLYLNTRINRDSLNPVIDFLREDILHLIESTRWNY
ncbi:MAG: gliding motility lipoprotein GldD [Bacteroidales bacterium]|nr:gliding motility lipoprotein GldD [Bacteroidales bacterium]MBN2698178.1 gliding motility lipoprotein GldD [Bacteroidales bacterium]